MGAQCRKLNEFREGQVRERELERLKADQAAQDKKAEDFRKTQEQVAKNAAVSSRVGRVETSTGADERTSFPDRADGGSSSVAKRPRRTEKEKGAAVSQP